MIDRLVVRGRIEAMPDPTKKMRAFADLSGGRNDAAALAIAHREGRKTVLDCIRHYPCPHNPHAVIAEMCKELPRWGINRITADAYAADFAVGAFRITESNTTSRRRTSGSLR